MVEQSILKKFGIIKPSTNEKLLKTPKNLYYMSQIYQYFMSKTEQHFKYLLSVHFK